MPFYRKITLPLTLLGSTLAALPTLTVVGLINALHMDARLALLLCVAALVIAARWVGRRFCLAALVLSLLFVAYYLPPYGSLQIAAPYQMLFVVYAVISLPICIDGQRLRLRVAEVVNRGHLEAAVPCDPISVVEEESRLRRAEISPAQTASCPRILFVDHTALLSGGELALLNLIVELDRSRYTPLVVLFADGPLKAKLAEASVETHILPLAPGIAQMRKDTLGGKTLLRLKDVAGILMYIGRLARFMRAQRIDLVHTNSLKADVIGGFAARLAGIPVLWHVRDRIETDYLPGSAVSTFRWLCRRVPDYVVTNSQATLETLKMGANGRSAAIPSGTRFHQMRRRVQERIQYTREALTDAAGTEWLPRVGLIGRIAPWKGQHVFLQAATLVRQRFPAARFQIIGAALFDEARYEAEIKALTLSLGLAEQVEFTGFRDDVTELILELDLLVHASTVAEPFGQVILEGMAAGKPVVATRGGGVPEIVEEGVTGLLVPMGDVEAMADAICTVLADPAAAQRMGQQGYQRVCDHFTIEQTARKVEGVYEQILSPTR